MRVSSAAKRCFSTCVYVRSRAVSWFFVDVWRSGMEDSVRSFRSFVVEERRSES